MINIALKEGWAGGPWLSKRFTDALRAGGFNVTDPLQADVLIAHSTACFDLPIKSPVGVFILIDPPYWPGKSLFSRILAKKSSAAQPAQQKNWKLIAKKTFYSTTYVFEKPNLTTLAIKNFSKLDFLSALKTKQVIVVRNEQDYLCSPDIQVALASYSNVRYAILPGGHDDYYTNPQPYIDLLYKAL